MTKKLSKALFLLSIIIFSGCALIPTETLPTPSMTDTATAVPTNTPMPTATLEATATSPAQPPVYFAQTGTPAYIANFAHPDEGCNWLGAAGQVFGSDGLPVVNLIVSVKGKLGNMAVDVFSMTGLAEGDPYGPGGYEIKLANQPSQTSGSLTIQVFDLDAKPLSDPVVFDTLPDCDKNLVIINFSTDPN